MTDKLYQYILYFVLGTTATFSLFLIASDNIAPFTTQASLHRSVATIAPEVSGVIRSVAIKNGQSVHSGDILFTLDDQSYHLNVQQARAELAQANEMFQASQQQLIAAEQVFSQHKEQLLNSQAKLKRSKVLFKKGLTTAQELDDSKTNVKVANSALQAARADIERIKAQLSDSTGNAAIKLAKVKLASAELDEKHTQVRASTDGTITNLQLQTGSYIAQGTTALLVINEAQAWLSADFNEKGMSHLQVGNTAHIAFDALPGQVFIGHIESQERAVRDLANSHGQLSDVVNDSRWIREQQKIRVRIVIEQLDPELISGARASVSVNNGSTVIDSISTLWIHMVSLFRYFY
ncbi:HlyD family secretion protein [Vibrio scophthalmi]|uniref:p-hydroxybenzoic acid efflux pump subunit AaeA n=1 Tax=Vibrio scophthalmi TaxID=45658 RepID=A0A1E3WHZ8_9VIBR|nr:HlyD family secretion protein [Vibrio scophthalmi]ODS05434.1 p-hydroxybenzoic acid efflux pump subunit AaeA [Vibrio scophthalmi]